MNSLYRSTLIWMIPIIAVSALIVGIWSSYKSFKTEPAKQSLFATNSATVINTSRSLQPFSLTDHKGNIFSQNELKDRWTLIAFGYTNCPDICPTMLATLNQATNLLKKKGDTHKLIRFVFVSVDPERDTLEQIAKYVNYFNPEFIGVTGTQDALTKLTGQFGILYRKVENAQLTNNYLIDHSASMILTNPKGRLHAVFSAPHDAALIAKDLRLIVEGYKS